VLQTTGETPPGRDPRGASFAHPCHAQATPVPTAPARPTPRRASRDGSPHPCTSQAHPMQMLMVPHAHSPAMQPRHDSQPTTQGNDTALPRCPPLDSAAEPPDTVAPLRSYRPLPALPTHCQQFAGNVGAQVGHGSSGGEATFTRAAAVADLRPLPPRGAGLFTLLISI
jgi:hypothetical protein